MSTKKPFIGIADDFPIIICSNRTPGIDNIESAREALHEAIEIKYFYEGSSTLLIGDNPVAVQKGDTVVINPYEFHATIHQGEVTGKYHLIMISLDFFLDSGASALDLRNLVFSRHLRFETLLGQNPELGRIICDMVAENEARKPFFKAALYGLASQMFALLLRNSYECLSGNRDTFSAYSVVEPALRLIRDKYAEKLTMDDFVRECNISKQYFCRVFKNVTGKSSMEYLQEYRLRVADALLGNTSKSVTCIAEECGFSQENYFARCYKNHYGFSPGKRRKKNY